MDGMGWDGMEDGKDGKWDGSFNFLYTLGI